MPLSSPYGRRTQPKFNFPHCVSSEEADYKIGEGVVSFLYVFSDIVASLEYNRSVPIDSQLFFLVTSLVKSKRLCIMSATLLCR